MAKSEVSIDELVTGDNRSSKRLTYQKGHQYRDCLMRSTQLLLGPEQWGEGEGVHGRRSSGNLQIGSHGEQQHLGGRRSEDPEVSG